MNPADLVIRHSVSRAAIRIFDPTPNISPERTMTSGVAAAVAKHTEAQRVVGRRYTLLGNARSRRYLRRWT
jgi:hypothetical protein